MEEQKLFAERLYKDIAGAYIMDNDIDGVLGVLTEDFCSIGLINEAPVCGKAEFVKLLEYFSGELSRVLNFKLEVMECKETKEEEIILLTSVYLHMISLSLKEEDVIIYQTVFFRKEEGQYKAYRMNSTVLESTLKRTHLEANDKVKRYYEAVFHSLPVSVTIMDNEMKVLFLNQYALNLIQKPWNECVGKFCSEVWNNSCCNTNRCPVYCLEYGGKTKSVKQGGRIFKEMASYLKPLEGDKAGYAVISSDVTEYKRLEKELRLSEKRLYNAMEKSSNYIFSYDVKSRQLMQSDNIARLIGLPCIMENVPESLIESNVICEESLKMLNDIFQNIHDGVPVTYGIVKVRTVSDAIIWLKLTVTSICETDHTAVRAIGIMEDITRQKEIEMAYIQEEQYRNAMLSDVMLYFEMNITKDTFCKRKGNWNFEFVGEIQYRYSRVLETAIANSIMDDYKQEYYNIFSRKAVLHAFRQGKRELKLEYRRKMDDGCIVWSMTTMTLIQDDVTGDIKGFLYVRDIDSQKKMELNLKYTSWHDVMTGTYNKAHAQTVIKELLEVEAEKTHVFIILDVDHFKEINDTYGHYIGDQVLSKLAESVGCLLRTEDIFGRIGGDEFVIFLSEKADSSYVHELVSEIIGRLEKPLSEEVNFPIISCSIGIAVSGKDGNTFDELYQKADAALYEAKRLGRNRYVSYKESMSKC